VGRFRLLGGLAVGRFRLFSSHFFLLFSHYLSVGTMGCEETLNMGLVCRATPASARPPSLSPVLMRPAGVALLHLFGNALHDRLLFVLLARDEREHLSRARV
jgi:hypothetical protein